MFVSLEELNLLTSTTVAEQPLELVPTREESRIETHFAGRSMSTVSLLVYPIATDHKAL